MSSVDAEMIAEFEEKMSLYRFGQHQDFITYISELTQNNLTVSDVRKYIIEKQKQFEELEEAAKERARIFPICPECGEARLVLRPVTTKQGPANVHGWKSCFECPVCAYEKYMQQTPEQVVVDLYQGMERIDVDGSRKPLGAVGLSRRFDTPPCPECGKPMDIVMVNHNNKAIVEDPQAKTMWVCTDEMGCGYIGELSQIPASRWIEKYQRGWRSEDGA